MLTHTSLCRCGFSWPNITGLSPGVTHITCNVCSESFEYHVAEVVDGHVVAEPVEDTISRRDRTVEHLRFLIGLAVLALIIVVILVLTHNI